MRYNFKVQSRQNKLTWNEIRRATAQLAVIILPLHLFVCVIQDSKNFWIYCPSWLHSSKHQCDKTKTTIEQCLISLLHNFKSRTSDMLLGLISYKNTTFFFPFSIPLKWLYLVKVGCCHLSKRAFDQMRAQNVLYKLDYGASLAPTVRKLATSAAGHICITSAISMRTPFPVRR